MTLIDVLQATAYVTPALEIIDARIERFDRDTRAPRKVFDTIADFAANAGIVVGGRAMRPDALDLRWVGAMLYKNAVIEESGLAAAVLNHPANGVAWLANKIARYDEQLDAGDVVLGGSFTRPTEGARGRRAARGFRPPGKYFRAVYLRALQSGYATEPVQGCARPQRRQIGLWLGLADAYATELVAGTGFDWLAIDAEHTPNDPRNALSQLQAIAPYPVHAVVRTASDDATLLKQYLDIGAQTLLVPMVETPRRRAHRRGDAVPPARHSWRRQRARACFALEPRRRLSARLRA